MMPWSLPANDAPESLASVLWALVLIAPVAVVLLLAGWGWVLW